MDLGALYRSYGHSVLRRARTILGSEADAKDVLHEIFAALVSRPGQFAGKSAPSTFLYAATTNACLARLRDHKNRVRLLAEHVQPWATEVDPRTLETRVLVRAVLAELPEDEARAAVYYHLDGMSHVEVAEVLGCSPRHVGDLLSRTSDRLRDHEEAS